MSQLHLPAETAGSGQCTRSKVLELRTIRYEGIARILSFGNGDDIDAVGKLKRNIFQTVNGKIDAAVKQRVVDFFGEEPLTPNSCQRHIENLIAGCLDKDDVDSQSRLALLQFRLRPVCLPQCERASSCAELEARHSVPHCCGLMLKIFRTMSM